MRKFHELAVLPLVNLGSKQLFPIDDLWSDWSLWKKEEGNFSIQIDMPGFKKEEISIEIERNKLLIKAEQQEGSRKFTYSVTVPESLKKETISAQLDLGVLTVKASEEEKKVLKIELK